jgi:site-specific DNA recombinase
MAFAEQHGYQVPRERVFEDEGFSGAYLERPGLERVRDLATEGQLEAVLVHSPDRLSRKYAYQVLLIEELARQGVDTVFVKAPQTDSPEDQLVLQFQGMIAEYERAQILERSRRGKRHRARQGDVSVLSGAPYGYHYVRKSDEAAAYYEIIEAEAAVVRRVYAAYTVEGLSIGAITRRLNEQDVATRSGTARWERSTVWGMLRNPAYKGAACFGKTRIAPRQRVTRPLRLRGGFAQADSAGHERPREDWIEVAVPAIVSEATFDLAQQRLQKNKRFAPRRTIEPSVVQGLVHCHKCGYAMYRTSTRTSARKIYYYRCLGSDAWRHLNGALCDNRPVRQELLDEVVWQAVVHLLGHPELIESEIERRLAAAREANPNKRREEALRREMTRTQKSMERLVTAYQETLLSLEELRARLPELRRREQAAQAELQSIVDQTNNRAAYLRLTETLSTFLDRLRGAAKTLDITEQQRIVRLIVNEVLVSDDTIMIRHSIPIPPGPSDDNTLPPTSGAGQPTAKEGCLLRSGRDGRALRNAPLGALRRIAPFTSAAIVGFFDTDHQPLLDQAQQVPVTDSAGHAAHQLGMGNGVKVARQVGVHHVGVAGIKQMVNVTYRVVCGAPRSVGILFRLQVGFEDRRQYDDGCRLRYPGPNRRYAQRSLFAARFVDPDATYRRRPVGLALECLGEFAQPTVLAVRFDVREALTVHACRTALGAGQSVRMGQNILSVHLVVQRVEPKVGFFLRFRL